MKLNIYVIDDDIAITDQLSHLIFEWAADRAVTVDLITKNGLSEAVPEEVSCFDLVILDVLICDKNGIEYIVVILISFMLLIRELKYISIQLIVCLQPFAYAFPQLCV